LGAGSDGNLQDKNGYTPLYHAVKRGVNIPAGMAGKISPSVLWEKFISFVADGEAFQRGVMQLFRASAETRNQTLLPARRLSEYCVPEKGKVPKSVGCLRRGDDFAISGPRATFQNPQEAIS
jgi:hypothetical protein